VQVVQAARPRLPLRACRRGRPHYAADRSWSRQFEVDPW
jgi:hypothetical protein